MPTHPEPEDAMPADEQPPEPSPDEIPWGQRFYDRPFLLLFLGLLVMLVCFTGWGLWEITQMTPAPLP